MTLPHFSLLAIMGVVIMALTGPFNAIVHLSTPDQLITTAYGRALLVKVVCVGALLLTSAIHLLFFRPRLNKTFDAYLLAQTKDLSEDEEVAYATSHEVKELGESVAKQTKRLIKVLRWEPVLGIAVLICTGLMNVFAGTLQPVAAQQNQPQTIQEPGSHGKPFNATVQTTDGKFKLKLAIAPNSYGTNLFTVNVLDSNGKQDTNVGVSVYLTMLDMDMGTETINLQPNDKNGFGAEGDLSMPGNWQMRLQVRTLDNNLHEATLKFFAPYAY